MVNKKCSILLVLFLLEAEGDYKNPISQSRLAEILTSDGFHCDRKTVGRDIRALQSMGYPIKKVARGYLMECKRYTADEVRHVTSCILDRDAEGIDKTDLAFRVSRTLGHSYVMFDR